MDTTSAIEVTRDAIMMALLLSAPVLIVGLVFGMLFGLLQALTQIQDQTVAFVPKLVAMVIALTISLPWLLQRMIEYCQDLITNIPGTMGGG